MLRRTCEEDISTRGKPGKPGKPVAPGNMGGAPGCGSGEMPAAVETGAASIFLSASLTDAEVVGGVGTPRKGADPGLNCVSPPSG